VPSHWNACGYNRINIACIATTIKHDSLNAKPIMQMSMRLKMIFTERTLLTTKDTAIGGMCKLEVG
jgi:hypothetical protein